MTDSVPPPPDITPPLSAPPSPAAAKPWGPWATTGFSLIIAISFIGAQTVVLAIAMAFPLLRGQAYSVRDLSASGLIWALATFASSPVAIGLSWLFAAIRPGITVRDYLGLRAVPLKVTMCWCGALLALLIGFDLTTTLLQREIVPEVMINAYQTAQVLPLLWVALVIGAPLAEEVFFRGFLFKGLEHSRPGTTGAILITAGVWSAIHLQYDLYGIAIIFVTGLFFGLARARTGSIYSTMVMHALMNLLATIQVDLMVRYGGATTVP